MTYDGTPESRTALERAAEVVRPGDQVSVVNAMPEPGVSSRLGPLTRERRRQRAILREAERTLARCGVAARSIAAVGSPASATLAAADALDADLIVVADRAVRLPLGVGSVGGRIARRARCDVLVLHGSGRDGV